MKKDNLAIIAHAVSTILDACGNSYINAYTEQWLIIAKEAGAYHGRTTGNLIEVKNEWETYCDKHGLPDWEDKDDYYQPRS